MPRPEVDVPDLYEQIVRNTIDGLELIREAISNSVDARSDEISISITFREDGKQNLIIQDNGHGLIFDPAVADRNGVAAFWSLAKSVKMYPQRAIGEKGLGSKTYLKAERVEIKSFNGTYHLHSYMENPLAELEGGNLPEYLPENPVVTIAETQLAEPGTIISIDGIKINALNPNQANEMNFNRVKDYILWKTGAGTFKNKFNHLPHLQDQIPNIHVIPTINIELESVAGDITRHQFLGLHPFPENQPNPQGGDENQYGVAQNAVNYSDSFEFHRVVGGIHYEVAGSISGENKRNDLVTFRSGETHKSRFGLYLCKDFIPIAKYKNNAILHQEYYFACHVFLNCQRFGLEASRNAISNLDDEDIIAVLDDFQTYFAEQCLGRLDAYMALSKAEKVATDRRKKVGEMQEIRENFPDGFVPIGADAEIRSLSYLPRNEYSTALMLSSMLESGNYDDQLSPIVTIAQHIDKATDMIVINSDNEPLLVEIEYRLENLFAHGHALDSYDLVVVWTAGDAAAGDDWNTVDGVRVTLRGVPGNWTLRFGRTSKPLIILSEIL